MMMRHIQIIFVGILAIGSMPLSATHCMAKRTGSSLNIEIVMEKQRYYNNEHVTGQVIISNRRPATYPVNFTVIIYRNGEFYRRSVVNTPVFMGGNEIPLEKFGMKDIFNGPHAVARWRIEIDSGGNNPISATAVFDILPEAETEKPRRKGKYTYSTSPARRPSKRTDQRPNSRPTDRNLKYRDAVMSP